MVFTVAFIIFLGVLLGLKLRDRAERWVNVVIKVLIYLMLFCLGLEVGANPNVISQLDTLGLEALIITLGTVAGSAAAAWIMWRVIQNQEQREEAKR